MESKKRIQELLEKTEQVEHIVIVGAGAIGKLVQERLRTKNKMAECYFDNDETINGTVINGVRVCRPYKLDEKSLYIIAGNNPNNRLEMKQQLLDLGIDETEIVQFFLETRNYEDKSKLSDGEIKNILSDMYYERFWKDLDWENPQTYTEKLNWEKLYARDRRKGKLADKYQVREYIKEKIGEEYLTKLYGVWSKAEDIDFSLLPDSFVLKINNGSGRNIIVKDKSKIDEKEVKKQLDNWLKDNFYYIGFEYQYKNIEPQIICEEYLEGLAESLYDYDVYCFHGEPEYIWCINGSHRKGCKASFYNKDWVMQPFSFGYPLDEKTAPKPEKLDQILELSRILAEGFEHVRVDWYQVPTSKHGILFSELTFTTWSGLNRFWPDDYDEKMGSLI